MSTWYGGGFPRPAIYFVVNNTDQTHTILAQSIMDDLIAQRFFSSAGGIFLDSASTVLHELLHAVIFRTGCFSGTLQVEENLVSALEIALAATVNVANLSGRARDVAETQRQESLAEARTLGGSACINLLFAPTGSVQFLSFIEGDPGIPGDGIFANAAGGEFDTTFDLITPFPLGSATDGLTVTVFLPPNVQNFQNVFFTIINPNQSEPCLVHFGAGAGFPSGSVVVNGVQGIVTNVPQFFLEFWVSFANQVEPGCSITLNNLFIGAIGLASTEFPQLITTVDAVAIGIGQNTVP